MTCRIRPASPGNPVSSKTAPSLPTNKCGTLIIPRIGRRSGGQSWSWFIRAFLSTPDACSRKAIRQRRTCGCEQRESRAHFRRLAKRWLTDSLITTSVTSRTDPCSQRRSHPFPDRAPNRLPATCLRTKTRFCFESSAESRICVERIVVSLTSNRTSIRFGQLTPLYEHLCPR